MATQKKWICRDAYDFGAMSRDVGLCAPLCVVGAWYDVHHHQLGEWIKAGRISEVWVDGRRWVCFSEVEAEVSRVRSAKPAVETDAGVPS